MKCRVSGNTGTRLYGRVFKYVDLLAADFRGNGEAFAAFCATTGKNLAAVGGGHACAETVLVDTFAVVGLICTFHFLVCLNGSELVFGYYAAFFDTCFLAGEGAEVVEFCTAYFTEFVYGDRVDERGVEGEDTFYADVVGNFTDGEAFFVAFANNLDDNATILLDTLFVAFFDSVCDGDGVAGAELGMFLAGSESLLGYFDKVHVS